MYKNLLRIKKLDKDKYMFAFESIIELAMYDTPLNREALDEEEHFSDMLVASLFDAFENEIIAGITNYKNKGKTVSLPANGHKHSEFELPKRIQFELTDEDYKIRLKKIIDNDIEKEVSTITYDDFYERLESGNYKYDNFLIAYKNFCKNETNSKKDKKKKVKKVVKTITNEILSDVYNDFKKSRGLLDKILTRKYEDIMDFESHNIKIICDKLLGLNSDLDTDNADDIQKAYSFIRKHMMKEENIYSLGGGASKREPDKETKEIHEHMKKKELSKGMSRAELEGNGGKSDEWKFYDTFVDNYNGKTERILGIEYDIKFDEDNGLMFYLSGTKRTGKYGSGRLQEEVWKQQ